MNILKAPKIKVQKSPFKNNVLHYCIEIIGALITSLKYGSWKDRVICNLFVYY